MNGSHGRYQIIFSHLCTVFPCLCAFVLLCVYVLELVPWLNLTAVNLICLFLACLKLFPGIAGSINRRKAGCFVSSMMIALAALAVNLEGRLPPSLSALSFWGLLWAVLAAASAACLAVVLVRLLRWSQKNWMQDRDKVQARRMERREARRRWWKALGAYWNDRFETWQNHRRDMAKADQEFKRELEAERRRDRLERVRIEIAGTLEKLRQALNGQTPPKGLPPHWEPGGGGGKSGSSLKAHLLAALVATVILAIVIGLPFAVKLGPPSSAAPEQGGGPAQEESAGGTYFEQWVDAVEELVSYFQKPSDGEQTAPADQQESGGAENGDTGGQDEENRPNKLLVYLGFVGLLVCICYLAYHILFGFIKGKLNGHGNQGMEKQEEDSDSVRFLDAYAVPIAFLMIGLLALYILGIKGGLSHISSEIGALFIAILLILGLLSAFELVRLVLEQCGKKSSDLRKILWLVFIALLEFFAQLIFGVLRSLHIESAISSLLLLVFPGEPDEIPTLALEKVKRILRNAIDKVEESEDGSRKGGGPPPAGKSGCTGSYAAGGTAACGDAAQDAAQPERFFRRKVWERKKP